MAFTLVMAALLVATGCASGPEITPPQEASIEASGEVEQAREAGDTAANERVGYDVPIRFNPSRCPCPEFEIWVYGAWQRVWLEGTPELVQKAKTMARTSDRPLVRGELTGATRPSDRNVSYQVFELQ